MEKIYTKHYDLAESLSDASIDRLMAIDHDWNIISWNKMSESATGIPRNDVLGKNLFTVFPQIKNDKEMMEAWEQARKGFEYFLPAVKGKFNREHYENHFVPIIDREHKPAGVMNVMHDVAHRILAEKKLLELNRALEHKYQQLHKANSELLSFTSITGNELKTPINHIYTSLELIVTKDGQRLSDNSRAGLRRIQASLNRINLLLDDMLSLSAAGNLSTEFSWVALNDVVQDVLDKLQKRIEEKQVVIEVLPLPVYYGSPEMLHSLFYNLLTNSIKFQDPAQIPHIKISASECNRPMDGEQPFMCITVTDNGIGFSPENKEKVFGMFERLHPRKQYPGSGVGLTICRKIAETHDGFIEAESEPGKGTTVHCYLALGLGKRPTI